MEIKNRTWKDAEEAGTTEGGRDASLTTELFTDKCAPTAQSHKVHSSMRQTVWGEFLKVLH